MVDACFKAIHKAAGISPILERYSVKSITGGTDALGEVSCLVREDGMTVAGQGAHSDIVMASALALVNALQSPEGARPDGRKRESGRSLVPRLYSPAYLAGEYAWRGGCDGFEQAP